jgi:hypothetical protein
MALFPERESWPKIEERPEEIGEIPEYIEKAGVSPIPTQFKPVKSDDGKILTPTSATDDVVIKIPATPEELTPLSKGSFLNSITWWATFWLRMIKKAIHFGWKIVMGRRSQT